MAVRLRRLSIALTGAAVMAVILVAIGLPGLPASTPSNPSTGPTLLFVWHQASYQGDMLGGVNHSVVIAVPTPPDHDPTVYVDGSFSMLSWTSYRDGIFNESGVCANSFTPANTCGVYAGIWTASGWSSYLAGGPMVPLWCFPGSSANCSNATGALLETPNLHQYNNADWEIVIWNVGSVVLSGNYQFTVYSSVAPS